MLYSHYTSLEKKTDGDCEHICELHIHLRIKKS